jgi:hypothetical protein
MRFTNTKCPKCKSYVVIGVYESKPYLLCGRCGCRWEPEEILPRGFLQMDGTKIDYETNLTIWNTFMEESGVRSYCQGVCKGKCCEGVKRHCGNRCRDSLACVSFICIRLWASFTKGRTRNISYKLDHIQYRLGIMHRSITDAARTKNGRPLTWGYGIDEIKTGVTFDCPTKLLKELSVLIKENIPTELINR